jgi:hypothetical protein
VPAASAAVPRLTVAYDDDPAGAADALLAVLNQPRETSAADETPPGDDPESPPPEVPCGMRNGEAPADGPTQAPALQKEDVCPDQVSRERGAERARPSRAAFILAPPSDAAGTGHWASATTHTDRGEPICSRS